jgi:flagellin-like hook-associated protein FlgL
VIDGAAAAVGVSTNALADTLATGNYTVRVTYTADGAGSSVQLFHAEDTTFANPLLIDDDNVAGGSVNTSMTVDLDGGALVPINFGNGLTVTVDNFALQSAGAKTGSVSYTAASTAFALKNSDGTTIDKNALAADFAKYMTDIQDKLDVVSGQLSLIGSLSGRLTFKEDQISAAQINVEGAYNRIMNANMAEEQVNASKYQILQQTSAAMLAQANASPQFLLSLFR